MNDRLSYNDFYINYQELPKMQSLPLFLLAKYDKIRVYKRDLVGIMPFFFT